MSNGHIFWSKLFHRDASELNKDGVVIIATRPQSSRLPGKAFMKISEIPAIEHILNRLSGSGLHTILAVPPGCSDYDYLQKNFLVDIFHGNPDSPLHRLRNAHKQLAPDVPYIIRVTHDDILIDQQTILDLLDECKAQKAGYGITPDIVEGAGVEIIHRDNLYYGADSTWKPTEYVSYFVKYNPNPKIVRMEPRKSIKRNYRLTLDYYEDWLTLETILNNTGAIASVDDVCRFVDKNPEVMNFNKLPDISVYTCAYNSGRWIGETIHSILHNHYQNIEYIVIDDGCMDNTSIEISKFAHDSRLKYFKNPENIGLASSSNIALGKCRGKYIMRIDADDILNYDALLELKLTADRIDSGIIYPAYREIDESGNYISDAIDPRINHHAGCALMDKRLINEIRFTDGLRNWEGFDLHKRIEKMNFKVHYDDMPMWRYRKHPGNMSGNNHEKRKKEKEQISRLYS